MRGWALMKFTASSEKFFEDRIPGVKVPPGHCAEIKKETHAFMFVLNLVARGLFRYNETYCSRPRVRNLSIVLCPLVIMTMFVGKRSVEDITDVSH